MTSTTPLAGIDAEALEKLSCTAKADPATGVKTLRATTVCEGGFNNLTTVRDLDPVLVSEPSQLLGDNSAPNPSEMALAALGSCLSVGLLANATHRGVRLDRIEIAMEADIDISPVWGVGHLDEQQVPGVSDVRITVRFEGDADDATLAEIHDNAVLWSPVVNTFRRPVALDSTLVQGEE